MMLYSDNGFFAKAYFITPSKGGEEGYEITHQYGCVMCDQFEITGTLEIVPEGLADLLIPLMGCNYSDASVIKLNTGLDVDYVLGESLIRLKDGRYIATNNCD